jgi:ketosteroid isomerase-like protein
MSEAKDLVVGLWHAMEARDWSGVERVLAPTFRAEFPQSGERFDREGFLRLNRDYPGDWHIRLVSVVDGSDCIVTEVEVDIDGRTDRAVSFFHVREGKVTALREYWPEPFAVPEWRKDLALHE